MSWLDFSIAALSPFGVFPVGFSITRILESCEAMSSAISKVLSLDGPTAITISSSPK